MSTTGSAGAPTGGRPSRRAGVVGTGLIAFLAASTVLFEILRWVGVVYLLYLAWQSWRAPTDPAQPPVLEAREAGKKKAAE